MCSNTAEQPRVGVGEGVASLVYLRSVGMGGGGIVGVGQIEIGCFDLFETLHPYHIITAQTLTNTAFRKKIRKSGS